MARKANAHSKKSDGDLAYHLDGTWARGAIDTLAPGGAPSGLLVVLRRLSRHEHQRQIVVRRR